jgi:hypothetical protein
MFVAPSRRPSWESSLAVPVWVSFKALFVMAACQQHLRVAGLSGEVQGAGRAGLASTGSGRAAANSTTRTAARRTPSPSVVRYYAAFWGPVPSCLWWNLARSPGKQRGGQMAAQCSARASAVIRHGSGNDDACKAGKARSSPLLIRTLMGGFGL